MPGLLSRNAAHTRPDSPDNTGTIKMLVTCPEKSIKLRRGNERFLHAACRKGCYRLTAENAAAIPPHAVLAEVPEFEWK